LGSPTGTDEGEEQRCPAANALEQRLMLQRIEQCLLPRWRLRIHRPTPSDPSGLLTPLSQWRRWRYYSERGDVMGVTAEGSFRRERQHLPKI